MQFGLAGFYIYKIYIEEDVYVSNTIENKSQNKIINGVVEQSTISSTQSMAPQSYESIILSPTSNSQGTIISSLPNNNQVNNKATYEHNNRYYYNQLDNYAKAIYDAIEENIGNLKYGNYVIQINYDFSPLLSRENGEILLDNSYNDAVNALNIDIPNIFYIDFSNMFLNIETNTNIFGTKYRLYLDTGKKETYYSSSFTSQLQIELALAQVENVKSQVCSLSTGNEYERIKKSHDWIIDNMEYVSENSNRGNVYGALVDKKAVCEGYARTYKYILDDLGINNILVTGTATNSKGITEDHMWNYVQVNNKWYAIDCTWDDPIVQGGGRPREESKHKYFLIGGNELFKTHKEKKTISKSEKIYTLPVLSNSNY